MSLVNDIREKLDELENTFMLPAVIVVGDACFYKLAAELAADKDNSTNREMGIAMLTVKPGIEGQYITLFGLPLWVITEAKDFNFEVVGHPTLMALKTTKEKNINVKRSNRDS